MDLKGTSKICALLLILAPSIAGAVSHQMGRMWPAITVGFGIYAVVFVLGTSLGRNLKLIVAAGLFGGAILRIQMVLLPASLPGRDLYWFSLAAQRVATAGSLALLEIRFYGIFSGFIVYLTELFTVLGSPKAAIVAIGIASGIVLPMGGGYLAYTITGNKRAAAIGIALTAISQAGLRLGVSPIAQTMHILTIALVAGVVIRYLQTRNIRWFLVLSVALLMWFATHKLPLAMLGGMLLGVYVLDVGFELWTGDSSSGSRPSILILLTGMLFVLQEIILSGYLLQQLGGFLFGADDRFRFSRGPIGTADVHSVLSVFEFVTNLRVVVAGGAISMAILLVLYWDDYRKRAAVGLVGGAIVVTMTAVAGWVALGRVLRSLIPLVIVLIAVAYIAIDERGRQYRAAGVAFLVLLAVTQAGTAAVALDDPRSGQIYLESEDLSAKEWGETYASDPVYADSQFRIGMAPSQLDETAQRIPSSDNYGDYIIYKIPYSSTAANEMVVDRDLDHYFYGPTHEFYLNLNTSQRNVVYSSEGVSISLPSHQASGSNSIS